MIKPGTKGYGIIPWVMGNAGCDMDCGQIHPLFEATEGDPYVAPAFVTWESPLDNSEEPRPDVEIAFDENITPEQYRVEQMTMPLLLVTRSIYADQEDPVTPANQGVPGDLNRQDEHGLPIWTESLLVPAWSVTPIDGQYWRTWSKEIKNYWNHELPWLNRYASLIEGSTSYESHHPECFGLETEDEVDELAMDWNETQARYSCVCGIQDMASQMWTDHETKPFDDGIEEHRSLWEETYAYARERWQQGWKLCSQHAIEQDEPSTDMGYSFSPFWVQHAINNVSKKGQLRDFASRQHYQFLNSIPRKLLYEEAATSAH